MSLIVLKPIPIGPIVSFSLLLVSSWAEVKPIYACEKCPYKQTFLLQSHATGEGGCLYDDATQLHEASAKCIRHETETGCVHGSDFRFQISFASS